MDRKNIHTIPISDIQQAKNFLHYCLVAILLLVVFISPCTQVIGQTSNSPVVSVSRTSVAAANEELIDLLVKIVNTTGKPISAIAAVNTDEGLGLVSKQETPVQLQAGDSMFVAVKVFVQKKALSGKTHTVNFVLRTENYTVLAQASTEISIRMNRNMSLFAMISNILLDNTMDSIIIPVRISNQGNTPQRITVVCSYPASVQEGAFHDSKQITLIPSSDTTLYFPKAINRKMANSEGFNITVNGLYENGDMMGMSYVRVQSARSNRNYRDFAGYENFTQNSVTLSSQSMFAQMQSYMLRANGGLDFAKSRFGYNVDLTTWNRGYASAMLRNTWIEYGSQIAGIRVGNINRNLDINLAGRGAGGYFYDTAHGNRYEAGYIDGNTNLLGNQYFFPAGNAGWGMFMHRGKSWQLNSFALHEINPSYDSKNTIVGNTLTLATDDRRIIYNFGLNGGYTSEYANKGPGKLGMSASAGVTGSFGNFSVSSSNYYSTPYYPGIQRGAIVLSERVVWSKEATSVWVNADYNKFTPQILSAAQFALPAFGMIQLETGISGKIGKLHVSAAPRFTRETSDAYQFMGGGLAGTQSLTSFNLINSVNHSFGDHEYLSINTEAGIYSSSFDTKKRFHLRSNSYYRKGVFNLNTTVQIGTFFMGEAANNFVSKTPSTYTINIIPSFQQSFFRTKLRTEASIAFMTSGYYGNSWYATGRVEYDVSRKTSFYTMLNYNRMAGYSTSILEMGITQKLQVPKMGIKNNSLELFVYKDVNRNNMYDAADSVASGFMLYINNDIFSSSTNGMIVYKNLPDGGYRLTIPVSRGWYAPEQYINLNKKTRVEIPLQQTGILKGTLSLFSDAFSYESSGQLSGITITATDSSGRSYTTKTTFEGNFVFYIPVGLYTVNINRAYLPSELETVNDNQQVKVETQVSKVMRFSIKVKSRKIEVKKFVSPSAGKSQK